MLVYSKYIGWIGISLVCLCISMNIGLIMPSQLVSSIKNLHHRCKKCRQRKNKQQLKQEEDEKLSKMRKEQRKKWNSISESIS